MSSALEADNKARDVSFLDGYSAERWECVLHYMVGSQQQEGISADAVRILLHAGLMKRYLPISTSFFCYIYYISINISFKFLAVYSVLDKNTYLMVI